MLPGGIPRQPTPGQRYRIGPLLGRGGMGAVYEAFDEQSGRRVAMKLLHATRSSPEQLVRFKREFRAAARLSHPHCLPVYELAQNSEGEWFYTMEYAAGGHLSLDRSWTWQEITDVACQVLAALDHIHGERIVHRDIKPPNVLIHSRVGERPQVKIADFGISKTFDLDEEVGSVLGSLPYLAPEQLEGRADPRSDLYALGMVLYEALAGAHPFRDQMPFARTARTQDFRSWRRRQGLHVAPLAQVASSVPDSLATLVMRLLEPRPEDRPATAAVVFDELAALLSRAGSGTPALPSLSRKPYLLQAALVGRRRETDVLERFVDRVAGGLTEDDPPVLFVTGPAGTGKSRLVAELMRLADERGVRVHTGVWRDSGGSWALGPLVSALTVTAAGAPSGSIEPAETGSTVGFTRSAEPLPVSEDPLGRYHMLGEALLALAIARPLLVVVEDAHWADATSLELLAFLIRRVSSSRHSGPRIGFVVTHRPSDLPELATFRSAVESLHAARTLELGGLGPDATLELVSSMLAAGPGPVLEELTGHVHVSSGGNPLLLGQTLHLLLAEDKLRRTGSGWEIALGKAPELSLPRSLQEAVGDRAARLSLETKKALAVAAVIGRLVELDVLQEASGIHSLLLLDCLDEALRAEFLIEHPGRASVFQFVHDRVRDAIESRLGEAERLQHHRRIAAALGARVMAQPHRYAQLAYHLQSAGDLPGAARAYERAGQEAWQEHEFARAADLYGSALALVEAQRNPADALAERYADACLQCGRYAAALARYEELLGRVSDPAYRIALLRKRAELEWRWGNTAAAAEKFETLLEGLSFSVPRGRTAVVLKWMTGVARAALQVATDQRAEPLPTSEEARRDEIVGATCLRLSEVLYFKDLMRALIYTNEGFQRARRISNPRMRCEAFSQMGFLFATMHMFGLGQKLLIEAQEGAVALPAADQAWNRFLHGMALGAHGDAHGYITQLRESERLYERSAEQMKLRQVWTLLGEALLIVGQTEEGDAYGRKVLSLSSELGDDRGRGWGLYLRGWAAARSGNLSEARTLLAGGARAAEQGDPLFSCISESRGALAALRAGDTREALQLSWRANDAFIRSFVRHPAAACDGIFLAAAAATLQREGVLPAEVRAMARRRLILGREPVVAMRLGAPLFWAGAAAWARARGRRRRSDKLVRRAIDIAERLRLYGELEDVRALSDMIR